MSEQTAALKLMLRGDAHTLAERLANHASGDGSGLKGLRLENRWKATIPTWQLANLFRSSVGRHALPPSRGQAADTTLRHGCVGLKSSETLPFMQMVTLSHSP